MSNVEHPDHYKGDGDNIECIEYIRQRLGPEGFIHYCHGNLIKYQHRYKYKGNPVEDIDKARVYLQWMLGELKGEEE